MFNSVQFRSAKMCCCFVSSRLSCIKITVYGSLLACSARGPSINSQSGQVCLFFTIITVTCSCRHGCHEVDTHLQGGRLSRPRHCSKYAVCATAIGVADSILLLHTPVPAIQGRPRPAEYIIALNRSWVDDRCRSISQWLLALTMHYQSMPVAAQVLNGKI